MKTVFSGIKPSGDLTLGNYIGSIHNSLEQSKDRKSLFCVVDLHAITVAYDPKELTRLTNEILTIYLASGFNLDNCDFFLQSGNPDHPYLAWLLNCITPMGRMGDMIQYKEKSQSQGEGTSVGLFDYPVLMAADILLYDTDFVPVGEDQKQHVELARDIAKKFNNTFGETFKLPQVILNKYGSRVRSLQDPTKKMSKSDRDQNGCIYMLESPDAAAKKIMKAVTDSESSIGYDTEKRIAVANLLEIYAIFSGKSIDEIVTLYEGKGYGVFKKDLAEIMHQFLTSFQDKYTDLKNNQTFIQDILNKGLTEATNLSQTKVTEVKKKMGFI